jgi:hypothetical protein
MLRHVRLMALVQVLLQLSGVFASCAILLQEFAFIAGVSSCTVAVLGIDLVKDNASLHLKRSAAFLVYRLRTPLEACCTFL